MEDPDIWTVNRLISSQASDGSKGRFPVLSYKSGNSELKVTTNEDKSKALAKSFFLAKLHPTEQRNPIKPKPCCIASSITKEQIERQL